MYPSIISQPGSASRNVQPIMAALSDLLPSSSAGPSKPFRVLEIGSGSCEHIYCFATHWPKVQWVSSVRNEDEQIAVARKTAEEPLALPRKLSLRPMILDVANEDDWDNLRTVVDEDGPFDGVVMINLIHCMPAHLPERIFEHLSPTIPRGTPILPEDGWIATYGPFLDDEGKHKSLDDEQFDASHIRSKDPLLGLRSIRNVSQMAKKYGFYESERREMPKGNMWVVWRSTASTQT